MAIPRIFISSTYYDLRYVRDDLERFIRNIGYEPITHEIGAIPYSRDIPLEESAYREVSLCDIIVCIIGGRYGTESSTRIGSITQNELKEALSKGVQVYVFVETNVYSEFSTYQLNKENKEVKYNFVDNSEIYAFLEQIYALPQNNPIHSFTSSADICVFLQTQWAGLFHHFLQEQRRISEVKVLEEMKSVASTLQQLVAFLTIERKSKDEAIKSILLSNHPAFRELAELLRTGYRVFFTTQSELDGWLRARRYLPISKDNYDKNSVREWANKEDNKYIRLSHDIFDKEGKLYPYSDSEWNIEWIEVKEISSIQTSEPADEKVPF